MLSAMCKHVAKEVSKDAGINEEQAMRIMLGEIKETEKTIAEIEKMENSIEDTKDTLERIRLLIEVFIGWEIGKWLSQLI